MSETVVRIDQLSKRYHLGAIGARTLIDEWRRATDRWRGRDVDATARQRPGGEIWALRDVSLKVRRGEVLGVVGRNGAGKSTLLKILSRITTPTSGEACVRGRIASLLEVGTGFHPELTGRENIFLNGVILGMRKADITRRFDEIVDFSGVEAFIDTPVKRYSTGMYVRLAFAVAAHLDPEILVVDEVLAVGDLGFQQKCLGKMGEVVKGGRTILFVSHNMQAVRALCTRSVLLEDGRLIADGPTAAVSSTYHERLRRLRVDAETDVQNAVYRRGSGAVRFSSIAVLDRAGQETFDFRMGDTVRFKLGYDVLADVPELLVSVVLRSGVTGRTITSVRHSLARDTVRSGQKGTIVIDLPDIVVRPGEYPLHFWLGESLGQAYDVVDNVTAPLMIAHGDEARFPEVDPSSPIGYFSLPSQLVDHATW